MVFLRGFRVIFHDRVWFFLGQWKRVEVWDCFFLLTAGLGTPKHRTLVVGWEVITFLALEHL